MQRDALIILAIILNTDNEIQVLFCLLVTQSHLPIISIPVSEQQCGREPRGEPGLLQFMKCT